MHRALQLQSEENPRATVLSIDDIGAFDLISRKSMLEALMRVEGGPAIMPFVRMFYGQPSSYLWEGDDGTVHHMEQGEGGEQGDPLMSLLFALGHHAALCAIANSLGADDRLMAFLDDVYVVTFPESLRDGCGSVHKSCGHIPGFASMKAKLRCGTRDENVQNSVMCANISPKSQIQELECGEVRGCQPVNRASECWGPHWVTRTSWKPICVLASKTTNFFWTGSQKCLTCSQHGLSFFIALRPVRPDLV